MAEEQIDGEAKKGKGRLIIIIAVLVVLLAGGGAAAFFMMGSSEEPQAASQSTEPTGTQVVKEVPASYVNIPQPFLFNVTGDKRDRLIQIKAQLMVRGIKNEGLARYHSPLIESTLLGTFASATVEQLRTPTGRIELRQKATSDIQATLTEVVGQPVIERVLFTDFVIQ